MIAPRKQLVNIRKNYGLTQEDLATKANISRAYLANIEAGKYTPSLEVAKKIASILNKPVEELFL